MTKTKYFCLFPYINLWYNISTNTIIKKQKNMVKKILPFLCSLAPFYAFAADEPAVQVPISSNPGSVELTSGQFAVVSSSDNVNLNVGSGGIGIYNLSVLGATPTTPTLDAARGDLYVVNTSDGPYGIVSNGDVLIGGNIRIADGTNGFQLSGPVAMTISGNVIADDYFKVYDATSFTSGSISSDDFLSISAGQINTGIISSSDGDTNISATGALNIGGFVASVLPGSSDMPTTTISGATITTGYMQNLAGQMTITSSGNFSAVQDAGNPGTITGSVENSGTELTMNIGGDASIDGTLKNDLASGTLSITANSLSVSGSDAINNSSFVNAGNAVFNISGDMSLAHGMNLTKMAATNGLQITAGTLDLGTNNIIANTKASLVSIDVNAGTLSAGSVVNGDENGAPTNASTKTTLKGVAVNATSLYNYGNKLTVNTYSTDGDNDITIGGDVIGASNAITNITASDSLGISGDVANAGSMTLSGANVTLASVTNSGEDSELNISAPTNVGVMRISGTVSNSDGSTTIVSKDLSIGGLVNNSGTLSVTASDTTSGADHNPVSVGSVAVNGGVMNIQAWLGSVQTGALTVASNTVSGSVLNFGDAVHNVFASGNINIARNVNLANTSTTGNGDVYLTATGNTGVALKSTGGALTIGGNIIATDNTYTRIGIFDAYSLGENDAVLGGAINVNGTTGVNAQYKGKVIFGSSDTVATTLTVANGSLNATNGGSIEIYSGTSVAKSLTESDSGSFIMHGNTFTATDGDISIGDGLWFGGSVPAPSVGMIIDSSLDEFSLTSTSENVVISGDVNIGDGNVLNVDAGNNVTISGTTNTNGKLAINATNGVIFNKAITTGGTTSPSLYVAAKTINTKGITNAGETVLSATSGAATIQSTAEISNSGTFTAIANNNITFADFVSTDGTVNIQSNNGDVTTGAFSVSGETTSVAITASQVSMNSLAISGGATTINSADVDVVGNANVSGTIIQGGASTDVFALRLVGTETFTANNLTISDGGFNAKSGDVDYVISGTADLGESVIIASGAKSEIIANTIEAGDITNAGTLSLTTTNSVSGMTFDDIINDSVLTINTNGLLNATSFTNSNTATGVITSANMTLSGLMKVDGVIYQNYSGDLFAGDTNITNTNYTITASGVTVGGINQSSASKMVINTSDLTVGGDVVANNLTINAQKDSFGNTIWSNIDVGGSVSGNVKIYGLEHMNVAGNYLYNNNSLLHVAVLPYALGSELNTTSYNYWADVSLADDSTLGRITNRGDDPETSALVYVNGSFASDISSAGSVLDGSPLVSPEVGINLYSIVDQGSAIWLLYAKEGVSDLATKIRNLNVNFCNADGSVCFNYFDSYATAQKVANTYNSGTENDLPIYLSVRDYNADGLNDSLYIVFDPRFGGPVKVFEIEPIVRRVDDSTDGEGSAANALDKMIAGQLNNKGFYNDTPIEAIPVVFAGTNLSELATELYNRMEQYTIDRDGTALAQISRLVQPRELEQVAGAIALNEHTSFRDFEDHMFDEFIWNRNRNLSKAWFDADFGMFRQNGSDNKTMRGNRFNITAGFDWQNSRRTILGLMTRISHMASDNSGDIDLTYIPGQRIDGHNSMNVADTDFGIGGYLLHTLGTKARMYANAMLDLHMIDISREQNYVDDIEGSGHAFSLISEIGLLHDWLNQYIVGNLYARVGYNFGFSIKEKAGGSEYMNMESDGYFMLMPGYSLIAQKRVYLSPWFQLRPYASIGIEYDVAGMPDIARYKFAPADSYSEYDIEINPLWANIGGGIEMLSVTGVQVGLDYRYQYNNDVQMHNIRLSGSIRF